MLISVIMMSVIPYFHGEEKSVQVQHIFKPSVILLMECHELRDRKRI